MLCSTRVKVSIGWSIEVELDERHHHDAAVLSVYCVRQRHHNAASMKISGISADPTSAAAWYLR